MIDLQQHQDLCRQFATLLSYPSQSIISDATACSASLKLVSPDASTSLESFLTFLEANDINRI